MTNILYLRSYSNFNATRKQEGVFRVARQQAWDVRVIDTERKIARDTIRQLIRQWQPVGIIAESGSCTNAFPLSTFGGTPVVFIDRDPFGFRQPIFGVSHDSAASARLAAQELLSLDLCSYAYVPWRQRLFWCRERETAYRQILQVNGKGTVLFTGSSNAETMLYSERELAAWLKQLKLPAGILAANDYIARQVVSAAARANLAIPDDLAVVGIDDETSICENTHPTLTSVRPDFERAGECGAELLRQILETPGLEPRQEKYGPVKLVRRESTRRFKARDPSVSRAIELIRLKACEGLCANDVLATFPVARRMAEMRFRKAVGHSVLDEIRLVRLEHAKDLLSKDDEADLAAVANFCGYATPSALYKLFMSELGCSPSDWAKAEIAERCLLSGNGGRRVAFEIQGQSD